MFKLIFMVVLGLVVMGRSFAAEMDVSSMVQRA
ncbi:outer membrane lipoprotein-sorting protein, partial [Vibrio cholerae]|nr:outer membrane lipoprotein-sorting protein [Vibrio cholerae]